MLNNRWLTSSLLLGMIITVSLISSIPIYKAGVMQKLLIDELEEYQLDTGEFPGLFSFSDSFSSPVENPGESFIKIEEIQREYTEQVGLPILEQNVMIGTLNLKVAYADEERQEQDRPQRDTNLRMLTGIEDQITLIDGKLPNETADDGIVEVLVTEEGLHNRGIVLDTPLIVYNENQEFEQMVKPVGVYRRDSDVNPYWNLIPQSLNQDFIVHENWFRKEIVENNDQVMWIGRFSTLFDYHEITEEHFPALLRLAQRINHQISQVKEADPVFDFPIRSIISSYEEKGYQMTTMLWSLNIPVIIMLAIYIYMISQLIVNRQLNEIAILSSRGASKRQIWFIYLIEASILGVIAFLVGPFIGLQFTKLLGASNGFLEFVQRSSLPVSLSKQAYLYAFFTMIAAIIMVMAPVLQAAGKSIVKHKQQSARRGGKIQWIIILFEIAIFGLSIYELTTFNQRQEELLSFNIESADLMIDPLLFFLPALFIIGFGLVALRIYPFILKGIFKLGEKLWPLSIYSTFLQVSRAAKQYKFLMIFLVMTVAMGVFSSSAARTINTNLEDQLYYENGAEIRLRQLWTNNLPPEMPMSGAPEMPEEEVEESSTEVEEVIYNEPPFDPLNNLAAIDSTVKVFGKDHVSVIAGEDRIDYAQLMAIETNDFGKTAWFRDSLLPHHWYHYLNLMANDHSAVLISKQIAKELDVESGDRVTINWPGSDIAEFVVYETVEYWPSFNPLATVDQDEEQVGALVVAHLPYVQSMLGLEPYDVWLNLKEDVTRADFYQEIEEEGISITAMSDVVPEVVKLKNGALLLGVNGSMTMGFLISLLISFIGFLLYWILTIQSRTLQYGTYRAMGISMPKLTGIMIWEQVFTSGVACLLGVLIGGIASYLYVPLFKISLGIDQLMPPFTVVFDASDERRIYLFVTLMLVVGSIILIGFLRQIKIDQAIKLGED